MNPLHILFNQPWLARLGWTLLHFLWQGVVIAALLSAVRGRSTSARFRYAAACAALALMLLAPLATFLMLGNAADGLAPAGRAIIPASIPSGTGPFPASPLVSAWEWISPWLGAAWLVGVMGGSLRLLGGWLWTARLRSVNARPAPAEWQDKLNRLMARMGVTHPVSLRVSSLLETPVVIGWLRPVILAPLGALAGLPAEQVEALLAHELAHIRRHDYLVNLLQSVAEAVLFYHPAVWWVSRQIRAEREHCCDDLAVAATGGDVLTYARALADLESCRPAHLHAMAASGGSLRDRIRRLVDPSPPASHTLPGGAWVLSAILLVAAGAAVLHGAESPAPAQEPTVSLQTVWPDTVKQGDLQLEVRGLGTLTSATAAEVKLAVSHSADVAAGQPAKIGFDRRSETVAALVQGVRPGATNGKVTADLQVQAPLPPGIVAGSKIDVVIAIGSLSNVVHVGRPVFAGANSEGTLFKLDPDGQHATRVKVQFGHASVNQIEITSGLQPGDRIILSDMSAYQQYDRIAVH